MTWPRLLPALIVVSSWLLTFAVHGVVVHAAALLAGRAVVRSPKHRDLLWKAALLIPWATATIATAGLQPIKMVPSLSLPDLVRPEMPPPWDRYRVEERLLLRGSGVTTISALSTDTFSTVVASVATGLALLAAFAGVVSLARRRGMFRRQLGDRRAVTAGELAAGVRVAARPMHLTLSTTITAPLALGRSEICLSRDTIDALTATQQQSVVLHERAHLVRRDPFWFALTDAMVAVVPWQPLIRSVRNALRRDAEFVCDDSVREAMDDGRPLVQSLAVLATAFDPDAATVAVHYTGSPLEQRARRLLAPMVSTRRVRAVWLAVSAVLFAAGLALATPAVSTTTRVAPERRPGGPSMIRVIDTTVIASPLTPPASRRRD